MLSVVIPAKNEQNHLLRTIFALRMAAQAADILIEVVVVDNRSNDETFAIAKANADVAIQLGDVNVGQLRNEGAAMATGSTLLFLDADVELTVQWAENIKRVLNQLEIEPAICGSFVKPPLSGNIFLRHWFGFLNSRTSSYLGAAHMLIPTHLFKGVGGFDDSLVSGEDSEFCLRASNKGYLIRHDDRLLAYHHGYPTSVWSFIRREWWHGSGDSALSKVKLLSFVFFSLHFALLLAVAKLRWDLAAYIIAAIVLECVVATIVKFRVQKVGTLLVNALIFYMYFWGRSLSIFFPRARNSNR